MRKEEEEKGMNRVVQQQEDNEALHPSVASFPTRRRHTGRPVDEPRLQWQQRDDDLLRPAEKKEVVSQQQSGKGFRVPTPTLLLKDPKL
jgi:hypothetical protein